jgi:Phage integrase family
LRLSEVSRFTADEDLVFGHPDAGDPLDRSKVRKRFQRACRSAGVRVVRFPDLRHTFGTRLAASGEVSLRTLQEWMGHRDAKTTLIYAYYQPGQRESEIITRAFGESPEVRSRPTEGANSQTSRLDRVSRKRQRGGDDGQRSGPGGAFDRL